mmetsp:Transcript_34304/g.102790  ORF Transcript_34304/g.102790 Transcript_34304/m.102790 type:complete len:218 (+) Transcript_34304:73-726(+)
MLPSPTTEDASSFASIDICFANRIASSGSSSDTSCPCAFAMVCLAATSTRALISLESIFPPPGLHFFVILPIERNSLPRIRTPSARLRRSSLLTDESSKIFLHTALRVDCISRLLMAHANSRKAGRVSSSASAISAALSAVKSSPSAMFFCAFSASTMARVPALAALMPAPRSFIFVPKAPAFCLVRAQWPPSPRGVDLKPRYSSAQISSANPMVMR